MPRSSGQSAIPARAIWFDGSPISSRPSKRTDPVRFRHDAHDRFQGRGLAGPIASEERDNLARIDLEIHPVQDVRLAVPGLQVLDRQAAPCADQA